MIKRKDIVKLRKIIFKVKFNTTSTYWDTWCSFYDFAVFHFIHCWHLYPYLWLQALFSLWPPTSFKGSKNDLYCTTCWHNDMLTICHFWTLCGKTIKLNSECDERLKSGMGMGTGVSNSVKTHKLHILLLGYILWQPDYCWATATIAAVWLRAWLCAKV